ncbi:hypothetical protein Pvag_pPag20040 (plasmid) [Pantoea vagans C9-1]|nr:hypothetical protein Pvag_pPag20040 [Pantoea vagans C9-1]
MQHLAISDSVGLPRRHNNVGGISSEAFEKVSP